MARFLSSWGVFGRLWFWHTVPVPASPQMHGLDLIILCGTRVCSQSPRAGRVLSPMASPGSISYDDGAEVWLLSDPLLSL